MKRYITILISMLSFIFAANAQNDETLYFYGVDFSQVQVIAANETEQEFAKAFSGINFLLVSEREKYDFSKVMNQPVSAHPDHMIEQSLSNDYSAMKVYRYENSDIDVAKMVESYNFKQKSGQGLILIAVYLDKPAGSACYEAVLFDINTREILRQNRLTSLAGGFGLRNYWARTVYNLTLRESLF